MHCRLGASSVERSRQEVRKQSTVGGPIRTHSSARGLGGESFRWHYSGEAAVPTHGRLSTQRYRRSPNQWNVGHHCQGGVPHRGGSGIDAFAPGNALLQRRQRCYWVCGAFIRRRSTAAWAFCSWSARGWRWVCRCGKSFPAEGDFWWCGGGETRVLRRSEATCWQPFRALLSACTSDMPALCRRCRTYWTT
jgi:hypothetical protein